MTFEQAIAKAKNQANRLHCNHIVYIGADKGPNDWDAIPGTFALKDGATAIARVEPENRHWNGSRLVVTQEVVTIAKATGPASCPGHDANTDCEIDPLNPCEACNSVEDKKLRKRERH